MKIKDEISAGGIIYKNLKISRRAGSPHTGSFATRLAGKNEKLQSSTVWLVCQHSEHKGWVFPKGLIGDLNVNESMESAAIRETKEEGGVTAHIVLPLVKPIVYFYTFKGRKIKKTVYYYLMEYISGNPKDHDYEMSDAQFMTEGEVKKILTYQSDREAFDLALHLLKTHP